MSSSPIPEETTSHFYFLAEAQVAQQAMRLAKRTKQGLDTQDAEKLLKELQECAQRMREDLSKGSV